MTNLLEKAFKKASQLSNIEQNALAKWLLGEMESDKKWDKSFAESEDILEQLSNEALKQHDRGETTDFDLENL